MLKLFTLPVLCLIITGFITFTSLFRCSFVETDSERSYNNGIYDDMPFKSLTDEEYVALDVVDLGKGNTTIVIEEKVNNLKRNKKYRIMVKVLYNEDPNNLDSTKLKKISGIAPQYFYVNDLEFNEKNKTTIKINLDCATPEKGSFVVFSTLEEY